MRATCKKLSTFKKSFFFFKKKAFHIIDLEIADWSDLDLDLESSYHNAKVSSEIIFERSYLFL